MIRAEVAGAAARIAAVAAVPIMAVAMVSQGMVERVAATEEGMPVDVKTAVVAVAMVVGRWSWVEKKGMVREEQKGGEGRSEGGGGDGGRDGGGGCGGDIWPVSGGDIWPISQSVMGPSDARWRTR